MTPTALGVLPREDLASWENEGGAPHASRKQSDKPMWAPVNAVDQEHAWSAARRADTGLTDTHTLGVMRTSFLILIPAFTVMLVYWATVALRGSG